MRAVFQMALSVGLLAGLASCGRDKQTCEQNPEVARVAAPVHLESLIKPFFQIKNPADAQQFLQAHPGFANHFLQRRQFPSDNVLAQRLTQLATNAGLQKLGRETEAAFQDTAALRRQLHQAFQHVRYEFPDFRVPPVNLFVSGLSQDVFVNDSLLVLGLDFFVGPKASYRPNVPEYILRRYTPAHLLPTVMLAVSTKYNQRPRTNPTMLSEMVQFGKALYFAEKMLPCTPDSLLIGYTGRELEGLEYNEGKVWGHFIEKNLLYNTTPFVIQKYVGERPNTPEIDRIAPGRVGTWLGWQIVRKYMAEHPNVTLRQLMAEQDAQRILTQSKYRPRKK
ncbi:gliding motility lipoprotein GldB [Hymenobacter sp. J193]|uniref:gliding motility lipoprotein GldB n=1 Tax=Hymenobacter sp. J193 TaxID=2898429 RepID=UPI002150C0DB|nr:gliding motility lipoprotein GldB [Hymenobacter sp. J193]MCR5887690.1 gliding motility lipoprotein GldB [Hymenobacter sp. J193]